MALIAGQGSQTTIIQRGDFAIHRDELWRLTDRFFNDCRGFFAIDRGRSRARLPRNNASKSDRYGIIPDTKAAPHFNPRSQDEHRQ